MAHTILIANQLAKLASVSRQTAIKAIAFGLESVCEQPAQRIAEAARVLGLELPRPPTAAERLAELVAITHSQLAHG
ncbi:hypothetical protein AKJ09_08985 [Labilithrix luteola]|uniref:Uncharacterized protein n=1 Tax=Labilithrix luteola TaxID=1391654 RepID=A0A0K1Q9I6_9BACT|nr:hypothetical protein [Labilithrix luteola]AKV02322.1 hypothetical protein AKJ09_08985 [Labilithrix luteola]